MWIRILLARIEIDRDDEHHKDSECDARQPQRLVRELHNLCI